MLTAPCPGNLSTKSVLHILKEILIRSMSDIAPAEFSPNRVRMQCGPETFERQ